MHTHTHTRTHARTHTHTHTRGVLETWAEYLNASLPDPGNQLCTDDFEGPSPHNVNLALKVQPLAQS